MLSNQSTDCVLCDIYCVNLFVWTSELQLWSTFDVYNLTCDIAGVVMMGIAQEAAGVAGQVQKDDPDDSGTSFSMDKSGAEDKQLRNEWFPLRPSAVGEDDEDASQVTAATSMAAHGANSYQLQHIPHAWSDDDSKQSPPERSQPDGRDGPDLKRTPWVASTQPVVAPSAQSSDLGSGTVTRKDSGSDVSVLSQPQSDHNITPLDIISRSVPPAKKGVSLMSELRQRHAPQLNSDSDTESPVSKLLGPNFRAVQQVLDRLKQDRLTDSVSDEAEEVASEGRSLTEESLKSVSSTGVPTHTTLSRDYGAERTSETASSETKARSSIDEIKSYEALSLRLLPAHNEGHTGSRQSLDESHRRYSESNIAVNREASDTRRVSSWASTRVPYNTSELSPVDVLPKSTQPAESKSLSQDLLRFSSATNVRMPTSTQPAAKQSSQELIRFSSTASSATNARIPASTQPFAKQSSQELIRFSSEASSVKNVRMPTSMQPAAKKSSQELIHFSSAASSTANARIAGGEYPLPSTKDSELEYISHHSLIDDGPVDALPPPLLPTSSRYLPEQTSRSSIESSLKSSRIAWGERPTPSSTTTVLIHRTSNEALPTSRHASEERLRDLTPRSSIGSSIPTSSAESRIPVSFSRELRSHDPKEEMLTVSPADNLAFPGQTSSDLVDRLRATSNDRSRTDRGERDSPQNASSLHHLRDSDVSASSDDTDDLLTFEPVLESDRQYLRMQRHSKSSEARQKQSAAIENGDNRIPTRSPRDVDPAARISGKEQSLSTLQGREGIRGTPSTLDDSHLKSLHWSLGAGTISPISVTSLGHLDSQQEKSSTPLGPISEASSALETGTLQASERSSVLDNGTLQEQNLEEDEISVQTEDRDVAASKQTESRSTTDISSSDEMYRPVLYRDGQGNKENRPDESVFQSSSYGIYDIRRSSGPGSTNRRRKALGLEPKLARQTPSQDSAGMVYISGESTTSSVRDGRGQPLGGVDDLAGRIAAYRETQPELDYYEGRMQRNEELRRLRTKDYQLEREANVLKSRQAREVPGKRDIRDRHHDDYLPRDDRRSDRSQGYQSRPVSSKDSSVRYSTPQQQAVASRDTSDSSRQLAEHYVDNTDPKGPTRSLGHGRRSGSSGKSRSKYTDDILAPSSQQARLEKAAGRRKHTDTKTRHRSRDGSDLYGGRATRLDANITKLSSLISKSTDESIASSSQTSVIPAHRGSHTKTKKHKMTSSSDLSDVSEYFNYAFMEPRLRSSIKHKVRLRELLKSMKSRDISPIIRARESTATESTSNVSSNETVEREKEEISDREPSPTVTQPPRPQAFEIPFSTSRPPAFEPEIPCTCRQKTVAQMTAPDNYRTREERFDDRPEYGMPRKRDVGVNCPTPVVTRSRSPSSDYSPQLEDASTQTEELESRHKVLRKTDTEPVKRQRKSVKSPLGNVEERGVISQPSPQKSDFIYRVDQREAQHNPRAERWIASQNSPDHGVQPSSDRTSRAPVPTWFLPVTSKPQTEQRTITQLKTPGKSRSSDEIRVDVFNSAVNPSPSLQKLSLQEAFLYARPQFVKRSQERVARIEEAAREKERRKTLAEAAAEEKRIAEAMGAKPSESPVYTPKFKPCVKSAGKSVIIFFDRIAFKDVSKYPHSCIKAK